MLRLADAGHIGSVSTNFMVYQQIGRSVSPGKQTAPDYYHSVS